MCLDIDMRNVPRNTYHVSIENVELFLSYEVRLKLCDDADADDDEKQTIYNCSFSFFLSIQCCNDDITIAPPDSG